MIANTATRSEWFRSFHLLLVAGACLSILLAGFSHRSSWTNSFDFTEPATVSEDDIDAALQQAATAALGRREGTIIVMDPQSGRVRAVVNPNVAFDQAFAPGSTIKPFSALAAMRSGVIDKDSEMLCREHYSHDDFKTVCSHPKDLPPLDPAEAIAYSCNYYFGKVGERLSEDSFRATLSSFGFGRRTGINVAAESAGSLARGEWNPQAALGEGIYSQVTPAQLLNAYAALVNGGRLLVPRIAKANGFHPSTGTRVEIDDAHRAVIIAGLRGAVRVGTAQASGLSSLPLNVFGKTGTSTPFKGFRTQGWFVGFASESEADQTSPEHVRLAVLVFVKRSHGAEAAALARPIFEEFARVQRDGGTGRIGEREKENEENESRIVQYSAVPNPLPGVVAPSPRRPVTPSPVRVHLLRENITLDLSLEDYVLGVVATEGSMEDEPEALNALAVAVRSYALKNHGRHEHEGFDFCSTTHCQRFQLAGAQGRSPTVREGSAVVAQTSVCDSPRVIAAVRSTEGEVLLNDGGQLADSYFSASCGGATANLGTLWGGNTPVYLRGVHDEYCAAMPHSTWTDVIPRAQLLDALRSDARTSVGARLDDVTVTRRDGSGRAEQITIEGEQRRVVRGWDFKIIVGRALGWNKLKSSRFTVTRMGNDFVFRGSGFGHGLGLCQEGAHVMAQRGMNYRQILAKYFPGTTVAREGRAAASLNGAERPESNAEDAEDFAEERKGLPLRPLRRPLRPLRFDPPLANRYPRGWQADLLPASKTLLRPTAAPLYHSNTRLHLSSEHFRITYSPQLARRDVELVLNTLEATRADLIRRITAASVAPAPPATTAVHINDTTGDFVGRTGQPWWAAAATRANQMELQPLAILKSRGVLTTTLRHELAHAFIDAAGHDRAPRWLAEGFALYLAGEGQMISRYERKEKLTMAELESRLSQSVSAAEMRALYAAAYREVSKLVRSESEAKVWQRIASH